MQDDEQAIRQLVATWLSASKAGDTEKVLSLMADDVVFLIPGQPPMRGRAAFAAGPAGPPPVPLVRTSGDSEGEGVGGGGGPLTENITVVIASKKGGAAPHAG